MKVLIKIEMVFVFAAVVFVGGCLEAGQTVGDKKFSNKEIEDFNNKPQLKEHAKSEKQKSFNFTFYAKIVDQHGIVVPDAEVVFTRSYFNPLALYFDGNQTFVITSDKNGFLKVKKYGRSLLLRDVKKSGYQFMGFGSNDSAYTPPKSFNSYQIDGKNIFPHSSSDDPAVIVIRQRGKREYLCKDRLSFACRTGETASKQIRMLDRWIDSYGLGHQAVSENKKRLHNERKRRLKHGVPIDKLPDELKNEIDMGYNLRLSCSYPPEGENLEVVFDYTGDDGGIILSDKLLYEAPLEGYQQQVRIIGPTRRRLDYKKTGFLYVKCDGGNSYSRLSFHIRIPHILYINGEIYTNPEGSRNLEYEGGFISEELVRRRATGKRFVKMKKDVWAKYYEDRKTKKDTPVPDNKKLEDKFRKMIRKERQAGNGNANK